MNLEMEVPKILWFKKHMDPAIFARYRFFDLPDFFTYKATHGPTVRLRVNDLLFATKAGSQTSSSASVSVNSSMMVTSGKQEGTANGQVQAAGSPVGRGLSL
ncbi:hypothetical protein EDB19DRAFT_1912559 [Suillus lakei]|nr:hypothetical protein EDB19DRAFT_1912559 [Suillus lakei]